MTERSPRYLRQHLARLVVTLAALSVLTGCSFKTVAVRTVANSLAGSGDLFSSDEDPELVRDAVPFALKTYESLLQTVPRHRALLVATCSGFTQYSYAFVQAEADAVEPKDHEEAMHLRDRALKLYLRGNRYCLRALDTRFPGIEQRLLTGSHPGARAGREGGRAAPLLDRRLMGRRNRPMLAVLAFGVLLITYVPWLTLGLLWLLGRA